MTRLLAPCVALIALAFAAPAGAGVSMYDLFQAVPPPPLDVTAAGNMMQGKQITASSFVAVESQLKIEKASANALAAGAPEVATAAGDTPVILQTERLYHAYSAEPPKLLAALNKRKRFVRLVYDDRQEKLNKQLQPCPAPCSNPQADTQNREIWNRKVSSANEELLIWKTMFNDVRAKRVSEINQAQLQIQASGDGTKATTPGGRAVVGRYRSEVLDEVENLLSITREATERTGAIARGAKANAAAGEAY